MNTQEQLKFYGDIFFKAPKSKWEPEDIAIIYALYNKVYNENKQDTGCGSCRRETILAVKEAWIKL